ATTGDVTGDITAALAMIPGLSLIAGSGDPPLVISAFGLGADANSTTLNGIEFGGSGPPRDGLVASVVLSTYDPKKAHFSGVQVNYTLPRGGYTPTRALH